MSHEVLTLKMELSKVSEIHFRTILTLSQLKFDVRIESVKAGETERIFQTCLV